MCGEKVGHILESPFNMEETLNGTSGLDINAEKELVEDYLDKLQVHGVTKEEITSTMKDLGIKSVRMKGPGVYIGP